ncbi:AraC family transcriptional regulator [Antiquaquibacter soli]|uniref:AraC family transcriptional regulator n=1 Tax=Antiquaquibacter soli TaxID=3064523 RepID=A0ABT9BRH8_9MICO|nr:AraC family transcriptional regulator [Protaetiibacter sp. WY-16]MDO7883544.1 AraC family transcriptional regulator [Protaetiibacter sp. WY-16]
MPQAHASLPFATLARSPRSGPIRELTPRTPGESIRYIEHDYPSAYSRWRYHPEYEIHLIRRGSGSYLIGDHVGEFSAGHVALIGPELPHDWMSDVAPGEVIARRDAVIQFDQGWIDRCVALLPEASDALTILSASRRGIVFGGRTARLAAAEIEAVGSSSGSHRLAHFFSLLSVLAEAPDHDLEYLTIEQFPAIETVRDGAAAEAGLQYILENFAGDVSMAEAAQLSRMSEPTFSRYFKRASGHTFTDLVRRLRIANACRLLATTTSPVATIGSAVGYRNLANFNRQFRAVVGMTPREYRALPEEQRPVLPSVR